MQNRIIPERRTRLSRARRPMSITDRHPADLAIAHKRHVRRGSPSETSLGKYLQYFPRFYASMRVVSWAHGAVFTPELESAATSVRRPHCEASPITLLPPPIPTPNPAPETLTPLAITSASGHLGCPAASHRAQPCPNPPALSRGRIHNVS